MAIPTLFKYDKIDNFDIRYYDNYDILFVMIGLIHCN